MALKVLFKVREYPYKDGDYQFVIADDFESAKAAAPSGAVFLWSGNIDKEFNRINVNMPDIDVRTVTTNQNQQK